MGRSAPGYPLALSTALGAVRRVVEQAGRPVTDAEIRDQLVAEGYEWPTRSTYSRYQRDSPAVTLAKVKRATRRLHGYGLMVDRETGGWVSTRPSSGVSSR
jgi:hypothetical protein